MPQASDELREKMRQRFGDSIDEQGPIDFLVGAGYKLGSDWLWEKEGTTYESMTQDEYDAMQFLVQEWDFGGLRD